MIPRINSDIAINAKYFLLEEGDIIEASDEYYNTFKDQWLPVEKDFIGYEFFPEESKPVRRKNLNYVICN